MPHATAADGTLVHYDRVTAEGDARGSVVLVQGLGISGRFWFETPAQLAARGWDVLVVDNRGTGRSGKPRGPYSITTMAHDLASVMAAASVPRATVIGISMGGMIAQRFAIEHGDRLDGLVLLATSMGLPHGRLPTLRALRAFVMAGFNDGGDSRERHRIFLPDSALDQAKELMRNWDELLAGEELPLHAFFGQLAAAAMHSTGFQLGRITCPTVVVGGRDDILVPPINAERIARRIPHAALEIVPGVAHAIPLLDAQVIPRALARLDDLRRGRARHAGVGTAAVRP